MTSLSAQARITDLLTRKAETVTILKLIGELIEEIIPHSCVWILQSHSRSAELEVVVPSPSYLARSEKGEVEPPVQHNLTAHQSAFGKDVILQSLTDNPTGTSIRECFPRNNFSSAIIRRIKPSNGTTWGCLVALLELKDMEPKQRDDILAQGDLWIRFAVTILERKILDEMLQTVETRLDVATKAGGIGIFDWDLNTDAIYWSPQMMEIYGISPSSFGGTYKDFAVLPLTEDRQRIERVLAKTFTERQRYLHTTFRISHPSGGIRHIESLGEVVYDENLKPVRIIGTAHDITERLRSQEQVAFDRRRLELALEAGELGFWDWDLVTNRVQFGGQWASMLGYSLDEIEPTVRGWEGLVHPDDLTATKEAIKRHLDGITDIYESEHRLRAQDGSWVWILSRGRVIEWDSERRPTRAIGIHSNITSQRQIQDRLREDDRRKDEFLATLAHELRNPLAPIRTGLEIMRRDPSSAAAGKAREIMERQLAHMVRLIDDLLDVSRITTGRLLLQKELVTVRSIIDGAIEASKPSIDAGQHTLAVELPQIEVPILCDPTRLTQTISNLLTNASKYTPAHGSILLKAKAQDGTLQISVTDNGLGIPDDMLEKVFDLFGQVNPGTDRAQGGLGIGLALVRDIVKLHGGTVKASSPGLGKGSTFTVTLPLSPPKQEALRHKEAEGSHPEHPQRRVLIVDDNVDAANSLAMFTELLGCETELAYNGQEALDKVARFKPHVVFLDIGLPGMSGLDVAKTVRRGASTNTPYLVAVTGLGSEEQKKLSKSAGFDEHLTKPVESARIESILQEHLPPLPN